MSKATRIGQRWMAHDSFEQDISAFYVTYQIDGRDAELLVKIPWSGPLPDDDKRRNLALAFIAHADRVAEWAAEHPDDVPTAEWAFT